MSEWDITCLFPAQTNQSLTAAIFNVKLQIR